MNKTKIILAGIGGVAGLALLVMAYFTWSAYAAKTAAAEGDDEEGVDGLETVMSKASTLSRKPVYPCAASLAAIESNRSSVVEWQKEATDLATRGDRVYEKVSPAQFKTDIVNGAKRLAALPGSVNGKLVKPEFAFGPFKDFIAEGKMPSEAQLGELQRRWDDVTTVVEILATNGVSELVDVQFKAAKEDAQQSERGKAKKPVRKPKSNNRTIEQSNNPASYSYVFTVATKPMGFVKAMNALVVADRFIAVDDFSFVRPKDALAEELGDGDKKSAAQQTGGRRGRRRAAAVEEKKEEKGDAKGGIVTDPLLDAPLTVALTVTVYDFRSLEEVKTEEVKK